MRYGPWPRKRPVAAAFFFCFLLPARPPILADQAMSRVRWRTERSEACPGRGPARITLRLLRRKQKRRSNRRLPGAGHRHVPRRHGGRSGEGARDPPLVPGSTQPGQ